MFSWVMLLLVLIFALPLLLVAAECFLALLPKEWSPLRAPSDAEAALLGRRPSLAVVMPAHDEEPTIGETVRRLLPQLLPEDRLIVVADNCTDLTAEVARQHGATVLERQDAKARGKGYALDFALRHLASAPPEVVVFVDADCTLSEGSIAALATTAMRERCPAQGVYLFAPPAEPTLRDRISGLAIAIKNEARPRGLAWLDVPCLLQGSGMAFTWDMLQGIKLASSNIVEDMQLGVDLAVAGHGPRLVTTARVRGVLPSAEGAKASQRTRWEHGHLMTIIQVVPKLLVQALRQRDWRLLLLAFDLAVPPLALHLFGAVATLVLAFFYALFSGHWYLVRWVFWPLVLATCAIALAQQRFARGTLRLKDLVGVPQYIMWKLPIYFRFLKKPEKNWVRTPRD